MSQIAYEPPYMQGALESLTVARDECSERTSMGCLDEIDGPIEINKDVWME